jgi:hypothetical protein
VTDGRECPSLSADRDDVELEVEDQVAREGMPKIVHREALLPLDVQPGYRVVRNCPFDCQTIPDQLKPQVAAMLQSAG